MKKITAFFMVFCFLCIGPASSWTVNELIGIGKELTTDEPLIVPSEKRGVDQKDEATKETSEAIDLELAVQAGANPAEHPLKGDGCTLPLSEGWEMAPGARRGDFTLQPLVKQTAEEVFILAKKLAAELGESVWPGFDLSRYVALKQDDSKGPSYIVLSSEMDKADPHDLMSINDTYTLGNTSEENLYLVFHEAFHCFQRDPRRDGAPWRTESPRSQFRYAAISAQDFAGICLESHLLSQALFAPDRDSSRKAIRQFIALRRQRQSGMESEHAEFEKGAESNEGLAEYAGIRAVILAIEAQNQGRINLFLKEKHPEIWMSSKLSHLAKMQNLFGVIRRCFYYTGAAQAFLLSKLSPGWKKRIQAEATAIQDLIAESISADKQDDPQIAREAMAQHRFDVLYKEVQAIHDKIRAKNRSMADSIVNFDGWKIVIDMKETGQLASQIGFDPNRVSVIDINRRVHGRILRIGEEGVFSAYFGKPVLEDEATLRYFSHTNPDDVPAVILDGKELSLEKSGHFQIRKQATVQAEQIKIMLESGQVLIQDRTVILRIVPKKRDQ